MSQRARNEGPGDDAASASPNAGGAGAVPAASGLIDEGEGPLDPRRWRVFGLTWLSYAAYYLTRKNYSICKARLQDTYGLTTGELGTIGSSYSAAYAVGQLVWGAAADRIGPRRVLGAGMIATALCSIAFGMSATFWPLLLFWTLNGFAQATGWSPNVKAMTGWFASATRGRTMGIWTTNYTVGSFVANPVARFFLEHFSWQWAFFGPAVPVAFVGLLIFFFLPELHKDPVGEAGSTARRDDDARIVQERSAARNQVLRSPFLWALGVAYFFLKLTRYFFWGWAPFYMEKVLHYDGDRAAYVPLAFEVGGMAGAMTIGWISDRYLRGRRMPAAVVSILCLGVVLVFYGNAAQAGVVPNVIALLLCGFFLFGPDAIVSATAAQDLGGPTAAAMAAGIINGMGSVGAIVAEKLAPNVSAGDDWSHVFRVIGLFTAASALILVPFWNRGRKPVPVAA